MLKCPDCSSQIDLDEEELDEGDLITCEECGAELRVLGLDPLELESADDEDEEEEKLELDEGDEEEPWR
jgi:alpha-aminoadipate/glutamate carrier protein LysW